MGQTPIEPEQRNSHGEPLCDECGMVVVDRANSKYGGGCLCHGCQAGHNQQLEQEFGIEL